MATPLKSFEDCVKKLNEYCRVQRKNNKKVQEAIRKYKRLLGDNKRQNDELERKLKASQREKEKEVQALNKMIRSLKSENKFIREKNTNIEKYVQDIMSDISLMKLIANKLNSERRAFKEIKL